MDAPSLWMWIFSVIKRENEYGESFLKGVPRGSAEGVMSMERREVCKGLVGGLKVPNEGGKCTYALCVLPTLSCGDAG